jgi:NADPH2:quinone reductase
LASQLIGMPRAVIGDELGPIENYSLRPHDPGPPAPNEVRLAVKAIGISFVDVLVSAGRYQVRPPVPFIPGSECAGIIEAVGDEVTGLSVGQRILVMGWHRMFADVVNAPATAVWPIPDALSFEAASVFMVSYATSWHGLVDRAQLKKGETLLVLGAGGATGLAAVQIGVHLGARVTTEDGWWLLRASNTQDVLVARAEARTDEGLERLVAQIDEQLARSGVIRGEQAAH